MQETDVASTPDRSLLQRRQSLIRANEVRTHRARLKVQMRDGLDPRALFDDELCETMKVIDLLVSIPKVGRVTARTMLNRAQVSPSKTLGGMSARQRNEMLALIGARTSAARRTIGAR